MGDVIIRTMQASEVEQCAEVIRQGFGAVAKYFGLTKENSFILI